MKSIDERAEEYARSQCAGDCALCDEVCRMVHVKVAFVDGAKSERKVMADEELFKSGAAEYYAAYANDNKSSARKHFAAGADWMRNELTRWRDPKEQLPADGQEVLAIVNRQYNTYSILQHDTYGWWQYVPLSGGGWCGYDGDIIGWREIHK